MSDAVVLVAVLAIFYLQDCSLWIERDAIVFLTRGLRGHRPFQSHPLFSNSTKGFIFSLRLPPLTPVFLWRPRSVPSAGTHEGDVLYSV